MITTHNKRIIQATLAFFLLLAPYSGYAFEQAFYILRHTQPSKQMQTHHQQIKLLMPQSYHVNEFGNVAGYINPSALAFTKAHHIKLMPLVTNSQFDPYKTHLFLSNQHAQRRAITDLLNECRQYRLYGLQFDFEGVNIGDKRALTHFFKQAADELHQNGYKISYAIVPSVDQTGSQTTYDERRYANWTGAYDLAALGKYADFVTLMTYDQHQDGTTPGPFASIQWMQAAVGHALRHVSREKLSLGVPTYSGYWHLASSSNGKHVSVHLDNLDYKHVLKLLKAHHATLQWDNQNKVSYAIFQRDWLNKFLYVENAASYRAKLNLAKKYHLRGVSVFALGNEDPAIWKLS